MDKPDNPMGNIGKFFSGMMPKEEEPEPAAEEAPAEEAPAEDAPEASE